MPSFKKPGGRLSLVHLHKRYDETIAAHDISLDIHAGEFFTLLGPSGSGKTTTLMMIAGFAAPTSGQIVINGQSVEAVPPERRNIGVVFQNYALFPHMTVTENLAFPLEIRNRSRQEIASRVRQVLELLRLEGIGDRYPSQLSGGQQQRVALGRAIVFDPPVLLMDEPLGALDRQLRAHLQFELRELQRQLGVTVVYVTHDQDEALSMSDRIAVMNRGTVEQVGRATELYESPRTAFVADFLGENNRLPGSVESTSPSETIVRLTSGATLACSPSAFLPGTPVVAMIRPERLQCDAAKAVRGQPGRVVRVAYFGRELRYLVEAEALGRLFVAAPNEPQRRVYSEGDKIEIRWRVEDLKLFELCTTDTPASSFG
jgi:putative spermidine/putrescine transport system ATP-binding protein